MSRAPYQPERGDFCWLEFAPQAGTEQSGRRPALVLSYRAFNVATGLALVCPVTSQMKGSSFEVPVPPGIGISGAVLADHIRSADWIARRAAFHSRAPARLLDEVLARIAPVIGL